MYLSYEEYTQYGGTLDETAFTDYEFDAESTINWYTFNRLKRVEWASSLNTEELKRCMYQLIRLRQIEDELLLGSIGNNGSESNSSVAAGITQESNDGVSVSYNTLNSKDVLTYASGSATKEDIINKYLNSIVNDLGRKLLYRGIYPGE